MTRRRSTAPRPPARRSIALDAQNGAGHLSLSVVLNRHGKPTEEIREARRAIELYPSSDFAHAVLGGSQMSMERLGEAKRSFDHAQRLNPRFPNLVFWASRGALHYLEGEIEKAVTLWEHARTMRSVIGPERIMLSHYYESAGRHEDAQAIVQEMLSAPSEITAEMGVDILARFWNEEWIPKDLEAQLRSAGLP